MARSSDWEQLAYRPLTAPWAAALELFRFAGAWAPLPETIDSGWGAWAGDELSGALITERAGARGMLHGPVVVAPPDVSADSAFEVATALLANALDGTGGHMIDTMFTRPQGLDRLWVRQGFIPLPESELPPALRGRPGLGLYGWRGGTALWSTAGRNGPRVKASPSR